MIEKSEIITMANSLSLSPDTVEKDYVLSWLLWGIHNHPDSVLRRFGFHSNGCSPFISGFFKR